MSNPGNPPATLPVPPPVFNLPIADQRGYATATFQEFQQLLWAAIQGQGGIIDIIIQNISISTSSNIGSAGASLQQDSDQASPLASLLGRLGAIEMELAQLRILASRPVPVQRISPSPVAWTPTLAGSTTPGTPTYTTQFGLTCEVGPLEIALFALQINAIDVTAAGDAHILGLPIAANASYSSQPAMVSGWGGVTLTASYTALSGLVAPGVSYFGLYQSGSAQTQLALPIGGVAAGAILIGGAAYFR